MIEPDRTDLTEEERATARHSRNMQRIWTVMIFATLLLAILPLVIIKLAVRH